jgi:hypothetical protein
MGSQPCLRLKYAALSRIAALISSPQRSERRMRIQIELARLAAEPRRLAERVGVQRGIVRRCTRASCALKSARLGKSRRHAQARCTRTQRSRSRICRASSARDRHHAVHKHRPSAPGIRPDGGQETPHTATAPQPIWSFAASRLARSAVARALSGLMRTAVLQDRDCRRVLAEHAPCETEVDQRHVIGRLRSSARARDPPQPRHSARCR